MKISHPRKSQCTEATMSEEQLKVLFSTAVHTLLQHQFHVSWCSLLGQEGEEVASPKAADSAGAPCVAVYLVLALQNGSISLEVDLMLCVSTD